MEWELGLGRQWERNTDRSLDNRLDNHRGQGSARHLVLAEDLDRCKDLSACRPDIARQSSWDTELALDLGSGLAMVKETARASCRRELRQSFGKSNFRHFWERSIQCNLTLSGRI